jgi:predicted phage tail component-like protein
MKVDSISFAGADLGEHFGLVVTRRPWPYVPRPRVWVERLGDENGAVTAGRTFDERVFEVDCAIENNNGDLEEKLELLATHFLQKHSIGGLWPLIFGHKPETTYQARLVDEVRFQPALNGAEFTLKFISPDPMGAPTEGS